MSANRYVNLRTSPPQSRKTTVKTPRPAPLGLPKPSSKNHSKSKHSTDKVKEKDLGPAATYDDDDMATGFPQFCVNCDRQILVPNNSLLYCSERYFSPSLLLSTDTVFKRTSLSTLTVLLIHSCKHMDAEHVTDYNLYTVNSPSSSPDMDHDSLGCRKRPIIERAIPTPRPVTSARIPPVDHEGKSDLDPTEWKPKLAHCPTSDASKYLSQFHRTPPAYGSPRRQSPSRPIAPVHAQTMSSLPRTAPSLSATPSVSSASSGDESIEGTPYDFANRSLPHRPTTNKSVELITPKKKQQSAYSVPAKPVSENVGVLSNDLSYEKKWRVFDGHGHGPGSLTTLLGSTHLDHKTGL
ncbi:MAG: hypothetical protein LQ352_000819 [Teloschistes flavicans]|nr:MAG: hypothetical protein LQ352_000819 [Teloschistes flavicans]